MFKNSIKAFQISFVVINMLQLISVFINWEWINDTFISTKRQSDKESNLPAGRNLKEKYPTVVTGYFDIGSFHKGKSHFRNQSFYYKVANIFSYLQNSLVVYTDSPVFLNHIENIRSNKLNKTKIIFFERSSAWSFQIIDDIKRIYNIEGYTRRNASKVSPLYTCAMHSKYYCLKQAAEYNYFNTKYIMWLDVGYFWKLKANRAFFLKRPFKFNDSQIAMNKIDTGRSIPSSPVDIIKKSHLQVGGGLVFGEIHTMIKFSSQYRRAVEYFLSKNLTNTDQQILHAMFTQEGRTAICPEVEIKTYGTADNRDWHFLGNSMVEHKNT
ncbi:uncharacterized protein LOC123559829 isoform X1 [Mercenaria mercenaria]|uniref:uncharacterized protein LOC123559829 isoform X1 n=1 Tax=Mercenaria mercenaria TaxID=6596 RepID=UPI001E1D7CE8|nr:uncharacterized protein LOC123559829 isoform X1 [Mercenaria mercenaria]